ncbi:transposase [Streptomyces boluensis]|uniref:transposase n=1 Tax=Streptomyces boluensis TaxID=1775135 RepID=UPI0028AD39D8|nr:transposase [Streptomyces boluensis]
MLQATRIALGLLAGRIAQLSEQIRDVDARLARLVECHAPQLLEVVGIGPDTADALLIAVGVNPERLGSEASFAGLCGGSPVERSSGHRQFRRAGGRLSGQGVRPNRLVRALVAASSTSQWYGAAFSARTSGSGNSSSSPSQRKNCSSPAGEISSSAVAGSSPWFQNVCHCPRGLKISLVGVDAVDHEAVGDLAGTGLDEPVGRVEQAGGG